MKEIHNNEERMFEMADKETQLLIPVLATAEEELGQIEIAPEVIEVIAGIAVSEVEGVAATRGNFASGVVERFGKKVHSKGIKSSISEDGIIIDVFCSVKYGFSIPKIAKEIQTQIRQVVHNMTDLQIQEVNVHITSIQFEQESKVVTE